MQYNPHDEIQRGGTFNLRCIRTKMLMTSAQIIHCSILCAIQHTAEHNDSDYKPAVITENLDI